MGVTGASSEPIARYLQDRYFCILPTSTVYCEGHKYVSKLDEIRQVEDFLPVSYTHLDVYKRQVYEPEQPKSPISSGFRA